MIIIGTPDSLTTSNILSSNENPLISLIILAPALIAFNATLDFVVSIDIKISDVIDRICCTTGIVL